MEIYTPHIQSFTWLNFPREVWLNMVCLNIYGGFLPSLLSSIKFECKYKQHEANKRLGRWGAGMDTQRQW